MAPDQPSPRPEPLEESMALYLSEAEIGELLTMPDVLDTLEEMFQARSRR